MIPPQNTIWLPTRSFYKKLTGAVFKSIPEYDNQSLLAFIYYRQPVIINGKLAYKDNACI